MPIPKTRAELVEQLDVSYTKLRSEIEARGPRFGSVLCTDELTVKALLAVRTWWTENVVAWVVDWRGGHSPVTPAPGFRWNDTPKLNHAIAKRAKRESYASIRRRLDKGYSKVLRLVDSLSDHELLDAGVFPGARNHPVRRWISSNTVRQYTTARTDIRRAVREATLGRS